MECEGCGPEGKCLPEGGQKKCGKCCFCERDLSELTEEPLVVETGLIDWADRNERWGLPSDIDGQYDEPKRYGVGCWIREGADHILRLETPMNRKYTKDEALALIARLEKGLL